LRYVIPWNPNAGFGFAPGGVNREEPQRLSPCVKKLLAPWFSELELDTIAIHKGLPRGVRRDAEAFTFGWDIWFRDGIDEHSSKGIALIGHEITHTRQVKRYGLRFFIHYGRNALREARAGRDPAGEGNPLEKEAYDMQRAIKESLEKYHGKFPCP
jgi:hypothetical protein